jgi:two-component system sensor histidine kinase AlgZ
MQNNTGSQQQPAATERLLIPDLCAPYAVLVIVLLSELLVLVFILASHGLLEFDWSLFGACSLLVQWIVLLSALLLCSTRHLIGRLRLPLATLVSLALVGVATVATSLVAQRWFSFWPHVPADPWWTLRNLVIALVLTAILLRYFYLRQQLQMREQLEMQARLDSLRARIRPHFLFNTLNSIASLIGTRPDTAEKAVEDLSELFRASLKESSEPTSVADELRLTRLYLDIEKLRLGERLQVRWDIDDSVLNEPMPALVLQPLVENAVYHGISRLAAGGCIAISLRREGEKVYVAVRNPIPRDLAATPGHSIGLDSVRQRMQAVFGTGTQLSAEPMDDAFLVELRYRPAIN